MLPTVEDMEKSILAYFYNVGRHFRDRLPDAMYDNVNPITGLPESSNTLKPLHRAVSGDRLALEVTPVPSDLAAAMMITDHNGERTYLNLKPKLHWTAEEAELHEALTHRLKVAAHKMGERGLLNLQPADWDGNPHALGEDGMTCRFQLTPKGLEEAKRVIRGTALDGKVGWAEVLSRSDFNKAPEWLKAQERHKAFEVGG